jgi:hypothetical protein
VGQVLDVSASSIKSLPLRYAVPRSKWRATEGAA